MRKSRSVHIALHDPVPMRDIEQDLFGYTAEAQLKRRMEYLSVVADKLNAAHRKTLLHWGPLIDIPGGYAGAKIALNRIPDAEDFRSPQNVNARHEAGHHKVLDEGLA